MSSLNDCEDWMVRHLAMIPTQFRPKSAEIAAFSRLFSSFFTTSFRVGQQRWWETAETTLITGAKAYRDRRHKKHSERRDQEGATELKRLALAALAEETQVCSNASIVERALAAEAISRELALWTYVRELVRRTEFLSQGTPVHRLWLELDEKTRKDLSVQVVWQSREKLLGWLKKNAVLN
jgi:hypothetical protein